MALQELDKTEYLQNFKRSWSLPAAQHRRCPAASRADLPGESPSRCARRWKMGAIPLAILRVPPAKALVLCWLDLCVVRCGGKAKMWRNGRSNDSGHTACFPLTDEGMVGENVAVACDPDVLQHRLPPPDAVRYTRACTPVSAEAVPERLRARSRVRADSRSAPRRRRGPMSG